MFHAANGLQSFAAFALMIWTTKMVSVRSEIQTQCSLPITNVQAGMEDIVARLAIGDNPDVTAFFLNVQATNATKGVDLFDLYQCSYQDVSGELVVKSTAICVPGNLTNCVAFSEFEKDDCLKTTLCPYIADDKLPSFTADCADINPEYPDCKLTCSGKSSNVTGMETCIEASDGSSPVAPSPTSTTTPVEPSPTPPPSGEPSKNSSGSRRLDATGTWRELASLFLAVIGHFVLLQ